MQPEVPGLDAVRGELYIGRAALFWSVALFIFELQTPQPLYNPPRTASRPGTHTRVAEDGIDHSSVHTAGHKVSCLPPCLPSIGFQHDPILTIPTTGTGGAAANRILRKWLEPNRRSIARHWKALGFPKAPPDAASGGGGGGGGGGGLLVPGWCARGREVVYKGQARCKIDKVHAPLPQDTEAFCSITFADGSQRETVATNLQPVRRRSSCLVVVALHLYSQCI